MLRTRYQLVGGTDVAGVPRQRRRRRYPTRSNSTRGGSGRTASDGKASDGKASDRKAPGLILDGISSERKAPELKDSPPWLFDQK